jgi:hypothetical protein
MSYVISASGADLKRAVASYLPPGGASTVSSKHVLAISALLARTFTAADGDCAAGVLHAAATARARAPASD